MAGTYTKKDFGADVEEQNLIKDSNTTKIVPKPTEPVRLSPGWEGTGKPDEELNFKGVTMDDADLQLNPPRDKMNMIFMIMVLHGIGTLLPWNMFTVSKQYFEDYKLSSNYTGVEIEYKEHFSLTSYFCAQIPNLLFSWFNVFFSMNGNLTVRVVIGLCCQILIFIITIVLAMVDSSNWPIVFYWVTIATIVIINTINGVYQNSVYGMAAKFPPKYTGAVILGSNISGVFSATIDLMTKMSSNNPRTAAIYSFMIVLFVLLACFDTYFALPINRYYRYHEMIQRKENEQKKGIRNTFNRPPYLHVFKKSMPQLFNVFLVFFVTLTIFPAVHSNIQRSNNDFIELSKFYTEVMCFMTFNIFAMIGSCIASIIQWPKKQWLIIPCALRLIFIPLFLVCNYQPTKITRTLPVYINSDSVYFVIAVMMALSHGYLSSLGMMYVPSMVDSKNMSTAGMFGAAILVTGIVAGLSFAFCMPYIVSLSIWQ